MFAGRCASEGGGAANALRQSANGGGAETGGGIL